jgi:hypothetical protein
MPQHATCCDPNPCVPQLNLLYCDSTRQHPVHPILPASHSRQRLRRSSLRLHPPASHLPSSVSAQRHVAPHITYPRTLHLSSPTPTCARSSSRLTRRHATAARPGVAARWAARSALPLRPTSRERGRAEGRQGAGEGAVVAGARGKRVRDPAVRAHGGPAPQRWPLQHPAHPPPPVAVAVAAPLWMAQLRMAAAVATQVGLGVGAGVGHCHERSVRRRVRRRTSGRCWSTGRPRVGQGEGASDRGARSCNIPSPPPLPAGARHVTHHNTPGRRGLTSAP